jgi:hypothetical protein
METDEEKRQPTDVREKAPPFAPGHPPTGGHRQRNVVKEPPKTPEEVRALLFMVLDKHTSDLMVKSLRKKIAKGNVTTLEFLFDRIIGRPAVTVNHQADGALAQFIGAWQQLVLDADLVQSPPLTLEDAEYREISLDVATDDDDEDEDGES